MTEPYAFTPSPIHDLVVRLHHRDLGDGHASGQWTRIQRYADGAFLVECELGSAQVSAGAVEVVQLQRLGVRGFHYNPRFAPPEEMWAVGIARRKLSRLGATPHTPVHA